MLNSGSVVANLWLSTTGAVFLTAGDGLRCEKYLRLYYVPEFPRLNCRQRLPHVCSCPQGLQWRPKLGRSRERPFTYLRRPVFQRSSSAMPGPWSVVPSAGRWTPSSISAEAAELGAEGTVVLRKFDHRVLTGARHPEQRHRLGAPPIVVVVG